MCQQAPVMCQTCLPTSFTVHMILESSQSSCVHVYQCYQCLLLQKWFWQKKMCNKWSASWCETRWHRNATSNFMQCFYALRNALWCKNLMQFALWCNASCNAFNSLCGSYVIFMSPIDAIQRKRMRDNEIGCHHVWAVSYSKNTRGSCRSCGAWSCRLDWIAWLCTVSRQEAYDLANHWRKPARKGLRSKCFTSSSLHGTHRYTQSLAL